MSVASSSLIQFAVIPPELQPSFSFLDGVAVMFISKTKKYTRRGSFGSRVCFLTDDLLCVAHTDGKVTYCCRLEDVERIVTSPKERIAGVQMRERPFRYGKSTAEQKRMFFEVPVDVLLKFSSDADFQGFTESMAQQAAFCTGEPLPIVHKEKKERFQRLLVLVEDGLRTRPMLPNYHTKEEVRAQMSLQRMKLCSAASGEPSVTLALALSLSERERATPTDVSKKLLPVPEAATCTTVTLAAADYRMPQPPRSTTPEYTHPLQVDTQEVDYVPNPLSAPSENASLSAHRASSEFFTISSKKEEHDDVHVETDANANTSENGIALNHSKKGKKDESCKAFGSNDYRGIEGLMPETTSPYINLDDEDAHDKSAADTKRVRNEGYEYV